VAPKCKRGRKTQSPTDTDWQPFCARPSVNKAKELAIDKDIGMELGHIQAASWVASQIGFTSNGGLREHDLIERLIYEFKKKITFCITKEWFCSVKFCRLKSIYFLKSFSLKLWIYKPWVGNKFLHWAIESNYLL